MAVVLYRRPHLPTPGGEGRVGVEHSGLVHTPQLPFPRQPREPRSFSSLSLPAGVSAAAGGGGGGRGEERRAARERRTPGCPGPPGRAAAAGGPRTPCRTHPRRRRRRRLLGSSPPPHRAGVAALEQFPLWFSVRREVQGTGGYFEGMPRKPFPSCSSTLPRRSYYGS